MFSRESLVIVFDSNLKGMHVGESYTEHEGDEVLEKTVDWRTEGAVSDVKDQGKVFIFLILRLSEKFCTKLK